MSNTYLTVELQQCKREIDDQILEVGVIAKDMGISSNKVRTMQGELMLTPLLVAKAQILAALVQLQKS